MPLDENSKQSTVGAEPIGLSETALGRVSAAIAAGDGSEGESVPRWIGRYRLVEVVGEGGMGTVWRAEQEHPRRWVALKVIRAGLMTAPMLRRFEYEADVLGRLEHPGIARIYHAGVHETPLGRQPYFAMEFVQGVSLGEWAKVHDPPLRRRLELMIAICQAVHYAHTRGVVHRDLKPTNILVTDDGQPKVLDFGVARATDNDLQRTTLHTAPGDVVGTLPYMAPEQAAGRAHDLDTSSDVYALGVIAYELLSGRLPYELTGKPLHDAVRVICEEQPTRLSRIDRALRGDVETIVGKALEKDRARRYPTAGELAADVRRYLDYEPIAARPPSRGYQLRKFWKRNRLLVTGVCVLFLLLAGGTVTSTFFAIRARRAAATATRVSGSLQRMLSSASPEAFKGRDYTVRQMLDDFAGSLGNEFADQPEAEADLRQTVGLAYRRLGDGDKAVQHLGRALELRRRVFGNQHEKYAESLVDYSWGLNEQARKQTGMETDDNRMLEAERCVKEALSIYRRRGVSGRPMLRALGRAALFRIVHNKWEEAESLAQEGLAIARQTPNVEPPEMAPIYQALMYVREARDPSGAEAFAGKWVALCERVCGPRHPDTGFALYELGAVRESERKFAEALAEERKALAIFRHAYPAGHWAIADPIVYIGYILGEAGDSSALAAMFPATRDLEGVESLYRQVLAESTAGGKEVNPPAVSAAQNLAGLTTVYLKFGREMAAAGRPRESEAAGQKASTLLDELSSGVSDNADLRAANDLGLIEALLVVGRREEAKRRTYELLALKPKEAYALERVAWRVALMDRADRDPDIAVALATRAVELPGRPWIRTTLGVCHYYAGDFARAVADLEKSIQLDGEGGVLDYFYMAMASHRLGDSAAAHRWYEKGVRWIGGNALRNEQFHRFRTETEETLGLADRPPTSRNDSPPDRVTSTRVTTRPTSQPAPRPWAPARQPSNDR